MSAPVAMRCGKCGGSNVKRDAWAVWNEAAQCWELGAELDYAYCEDCDAETRIEAVELSSAEAVEYAKSALGSLADVMSLSYSDFAGDLSRLAAVQAAGPWAGIVIGEPMKCETCGKAVTIDRLDAKPYALRRRWFSFLIPRRIALWRLRRAADRGAAFDHLECRNCYGAGFHPQ